jgi:hypothetical protein
MKKSQRPIRKLKLDGETVRRLDRGELPAVVAGEGPVETITGNSNCLSTMVCNHCPA